GRPGRPGRRPGTAVAALRRPGRRAPAARLLPRPRDGRGGPRAVPRVPRLAERLAPPPRRAGRPRRARPRHRPGRGGAGRLDRPRPAARPGHHRRPGRGRARPGIAARLAVPLTRTAAAPVTGPGTPRAPTPGRPG